MQKVAQSELPRVFRSGEVVLGVGVMGILMVMVFPMPKPFMDLMLAFNITFSILIMMVALYVLQPLDFAVFPTILLVATLFRLSLNVASTRLILLNGHEGADAAGRVIQAFGGFVVGGNFVVGMVVFFILVIINFIVITKGSGRIAEVAARFTLDAMPGKQMSIDADLNAGLIDDRMAKDRRRQIEREADFYGAMDGASKFVRGDAIAGMIITIINILGGLVIGIGQKGMPVVDAAKTYTILTIGDGLVSQIPALIVSTAAGLVVTRSASDSYLGVDLMRQVLTNVRAVGVASGILLGLAMVPGLPTAPFLALSAVMAGLAWQVHRVQRAQAAARAEVEMVESKEEVKEDATTLLAPLDALELQIGYGLIPLVESKEESTLLERIRMIRRQMALDMGIIIPFIHIRDNLQLKPNEYSIRLRGVPVARAELMLQSCLALDAGDVRTPLAGVPTREPTFGLPAVWIPNEDREQAQAAGYTVVDPETVLITHLSEVVRSHLHELVSRQDVQRLVENVARDHPKVVEELVPKLLSLGEVHRVIQNLLKEQVSVRDLVQILEILGDWAPHTKNPRVLAEYVRWGLARAITRNHLDDEGTLAAILLDPALEERLAENVRPGEVDVSFTLDPELARQVIREVQKSLEPHLNRDQHPVLLCDAVLRPHLKQLLERYIPTLAVLSHNEVARDITVQTIDVVRLSHEG